MNNIKKYQYDDIEIYAARIYEEIEKMVRNYSSFMARDLDSNHQDKFQELMMFKISHELCGNAFYLGKSKSIPPKNEEEINSEIGNMINNFKENMNEMISRLKEMKK